MNKIKIIALSIVALSFLVAIWAYPQMPEMMASHWNYKGEVDGYMPKVLGLFLLPILSAVFFVVFSYIPKIDPQKDNIEKFKKYYDIFVLSFEFFMFYVYLLTVLWGRGLVFDMTAAITPAFALLFFYLGIMIEKTEPNWFIGIRTPWTLSSEEVWKKTHQIGGRLFKIVGVIAFIGLLFPSYAVFLILLPVICVSLFLVIYSYLEYNNINKN